MRLMLAFARMMGAAGRRRLARFARDRRGVTAIEFSMLAAPFFGLVLGFFEIAYVHITSEGLQNAVSLASRQLLVGNSQNLVLTTAAQFRDTLLCPASGRVMPNNIDCSKLIIDVRTATSFTGANTSNDFYKTATQYCPGAGQKIVIVRVAYPLATILPLSFTNPYVGLVHDVPGISSWVHLLFGEAAFQTEPFTTANLPTC